ncbi:biotin transporter BioY [Isoptericola sp. NEAU-Y5]|uniref:Biotin transporter n=1 Tax=Isoptericola luteus TaxID=2879484 RepID=A0ABS7ZCS4_9MICO|nr:biotin transporter BioY [Isoptericola sp. NEAU-Y5]MCA5892832.1 biotin transporter BioY [Isoptericola sp. NEAU-Y5]
MTTIAQHPALLADRVLPRSLATDAGLVLGGAAITALLAQVYVPLPLVPITGQTMAVLLVGATLGATRGAMSMSVYALLGLVGFPVFSEGSSGMAVVLGPTGGYIVGFVLAAALVGRLAELRWERTFAKALLTFVAGTGVTFLVGLPWLAAVAGLDLQATLAAGLFPFVLPGLVKAAIVAGLMPLAWKGAEAITARRDR